MSSFCSCLEQGVRSQARPGKGSPGPIWGAAPVRVGGSPLLPWKRGRLSRPCRTTTGQRPLLAGPSLLPLPGDPSSHLNASSWHQPAPSRPQEHTRD